MPTSPADWYWVGPNGFISSDQNPTISSVTTAAAGTYTVSFTTSVVPTELMNTVSSISIEDFVPQLESTTEVAVLGNPVAINNGPICEGDMLELSATTINGATYAWTGPNGFTSSLQNPTIENATPQAAGEYSVTATVEGVSSAPATTTVVVHPAPAGCTITAPVTVAFGSDGNSAAIVEGSTPGATYTWVIYVDGVLDNSLITAGQNTSEITWSAPAVFETIDIGVVVETANGCVCDNDPPVAGQFPGNGVQIAAQSADIPTVSEWVMILFSLLLAATAVIYMKRKHNQII